MIGSRRSSFPSQASYSYVFVLASERGPLFDRTLVVDHDHGDDLLCEATARELVYEERESQRSDCVSRCERERERLDTLDYSRTYTGGIWSQLFLITVSWSLAILPYFYDETILRLLHGFFNGLQVTFASCRVQACHFDCFREASFSFRSFCSMMR
jgi:hypothetical protein